MLKNVTLIGTIWHVILGAQDRCRIYPGRCASFGSELRTGFFVANRRHSAAVCPIWKNIWHFAWDFWEPCPVQLQLRFKCPAPKSTELFQRNFVRNGRNIINSWIILWTPRIENRSVIKTCFHIDYSRGCSQITVMSSHRRKHFFFLTQLINTKIVQNKHKTNLDSPPCCDYVNSLPCCDYVNSPPCCDYVSWLRNAA